MLQVPAHLSRATMDGGTSFRKQLLVLQLALLSAASLGKEVVLGEVGKMVELPCKSTTHFFVWKVNDTKLVSKQNQHCLKGPTQQNRYECKKNEWDQGSFPMIIKNLQVRDSGNYICEVHTAQKQEVQLLVFTLKSSPGPRLLQGQKLTLTLEGPVGSKPSVQWKDPMANSKNGDKIFSVDQVQSKDSGTWTCTVSQGQKTLELRINIQVLSFQKDTTLIYKKVGEQATFSFPLNFQGENLNGELTWQEEGSSSPKTWISFFFRDQKVTTTSESKFQLMNSLPLTFVIPQVSPQYAGSGNLTLHLAEGTAKGTIQHKVSLVVMKVTQSQDVLLCEVLGPSPSTAMLILQLENQAEKIHSKQKVVKLSDPETGMWFCRLKNQSKVLLEYTTEVSLPDHFSNQQAIFLGTGLGGGLLLILLVCCILCVTCRTRRRKAQRMSQIKRLLSEKKTCQCPHRFQKTCHLI
ncbi:T-cell surface glycoprotein CD4 [Tenrec ecaudatus]|uniref:T-cell surface glycoprotein CD4 n=1 Tax=Tenrec ecaudatus TaxID=94439 RepID=UPI003F5A6920